MGGTMTTPTGSDDKPRERRVAALEIAFSALPTLLAALVAGYFAGAWLDRQFGVTPVCQAVGVLAGAAYGLMRIVQLAMKLE
jgi:F0F1-type ATP synthase assembly protein I